MVNNCDLILEEEGPEADHPALDHNANSKYPFVDGRWCALRICSVIDAQVVNVRLYEDDEEIVQSGLLLGQVPRSKRGMLAKADLQITVALPYPVKRHNLCTEILNSGGISSRHTDIKFGEVRRVMPSNEEIEVKGETPDRYFNNRGMPLSNDLVDSGSSSSSSSSSNRASESISDHVTLVIPIVRGLSSEMPMFDEFNYHKQHVIHHTVRIPGISYKTEKGESTANNTTWYIRMSISEALGRVEVTSITTEFLDHKRLHAHWNTFLSFCDDVKTKVSTWATDCSNSVSRKMSSSSSSYSEEGQYKMHDHELILEEDSSDVSIFSGQPLQQPQINQALPAGSVYTLPGPPVAANSMSFPPMNAPADASGERYIFYAVPASQVAAAAAAAGGASPVAAMPVLPSVPSNSFPIEVYSSTRQAVKSS